MRRLLALAACLTLGLLLAWRTSTPPTPLPTNAPASVFSAGRAMADVRAIGRTPHPMGSAAHEEARAWILGRLQALGLSEIAVVEARRAAVTPGRSPLISGGLVRNITAVLPGRDRRSPPVVLMAHYDTVPNSPGAADDTAGVATILEVVRALKAAGTPARDVRVIITDGEEFGLLGARAAFGAGRPAPKGFVINLETRGGGGRALMFQAGRQNAGQIELFRRSAVRPLASSLTGFVYARLPNDTDFTIARNAGWQGLNFAFVGRQFDYHSPTSTPGNLDQAALQDLGAQALAAAKAAAFAPALPARGPDQVYFQAFGDVLVAYPPAAGWLVIAAAAALIAVALRGQRDQLRWKAVTQDASGALFVVVGAAAVLRLARRLTGVPAGFVEQRPLLAQAAAFETALALALLGLLLVTTAALASGGRRRLMLGGALAVAAGFLIGGTDTVGAGLCAGAALLGLIAFGGPLALADVWLGGLLATLLLAIVAQASAPEAAFILAWPLLAASAAAALTRFGRHTGLPARLAAGAIAAAAVGWIGSFAHLGYVAVDLPELGGLFALLLLLVLLPLAWPSLHERRALPLAGALLALGLAGALGLRLSDPWSVRHPQVTQVAFVQQIDSGRAWRVSFSPDLPDWSRRVLQADGGRIARLSLPPLFRRPVEAAPARAIAAAGVRTDLAPAGPAVWRLAAAPAPGARVLALDVTADQPIVVTGVLSADGPVGGMSPIALAAGQTMRLRWRADAEPIAVAFTAPAAGGFTVDAAAVFDGWPAQASPLPPRGRGLMPFDISDSTVVASSERLAWRTGGSRAKPSP